jgi:hypothetical protein
MMPERRLKVLPQLSRNHLKCAGDPFMQNVCQQCQHKNLPENRFCTRCGTRLESQSQSLAKLYALDGHDEFKTIDLNEKENFIGREKSNSIVLEDEKVSKQHAIIYQKDKIYYIEDLKSKNGVFINGRKIKKKTQLMRGALIKIGSMFFRFELVHNS